MNDLERTAAHEAGHSVAARVVGYRVGQVTIAAGPALAGCAWFVPRRWPAADLERLDLTAAFETWPARIRTGIVRRAIVHAAGDVAEHEFMPHAMGRSSETVIERAVERLERVPALTLAEAAAITSRMADTDVAGQSDDESLWKLALLAHGTDHASAAAWLRYCAAQARAVLVANRGSVARLAGLLLEQRSLSAAAVRAVLG